MNYLATGMFLTTLALSMTSTAYAETVNCSYCDGEPTVCGEVSKEIKLDGSPEDRTLEWNNGIREFRLNYGVEKDKKGKFRINQSNLSAWVKETDQFVAAAAQSTDGTILITFGGFRNSLSKSALCRVR